MGFVVEGIRPPGTLKGEFLNPQIINVRSIEVVVLSLSGLRYCELTDFADVGRVFTKVKIRRPPECRSLRQGEKELQMGSISLKDSYLLFFSKIKRGRYLLVQKPAPAKND